MAHEPGAPSEVVASIRKNLTCALCQELLQDPRILPCLHTFCIQCIEQLVRNRTVAHTVSCPTCAQEISLESRKAARELPANSLLVSLLDVLSIQQGEPINCDVCDETEESVATVRCKECAQFMCELHAKGHKRAKGTKIHTLFLPEHLRSLSLKELHRPSFCKTHTNERLTMFCDSCNASICHNCAVRDHKRHRCQFVDEAYTKTCPKLTDLLDKTKSMCVRVEKAVPVLDYTLRMVNAKADGTIREIDECINSKIKALEQRRKELRAAVELVRIARKSALQQQKNRLVAARDKLRGSCHFVKRTLEEGDAVYLLSTKDLISQRLESLLAEEHEFSPREDYHLKLCSKDEALLEEIGAFGYLDTCYPCFATSTVEGKGLSDARLRIQADFTVITRDRKGKIFTGEETQLEVQIESPTGANQVIAEITTKNEGRHVVRYSPSAVGQHRIHVTIRGFPLKLSPFTVNVSYDKRDYRNMTEPQVVIGCHGSHPGHLDGVRGVAVDHRNRIIVCDRNNFRVQVFDTTGNFLFQFGQKGTEEGEFRGGPSGVAVGENGSIIVSDWNGSSIQVFDSEGKFLARLESSRKVRGQNFGNFCHVAANPEGRIFVSDYQNKEIQVFDSSGQSLYNFSGSTTDESDGLLNGPNGIAVNSKGEVIVALANDGGFQVFTQEGKPLRRVRLQQKELFHEPNTFFVPEAIAVDSEDNIFAADSNSNSLIVFSKDGEFLARPAQQSLNGPFGVALDNLGRVVVTDSSDQVKIF